MSSVEILDDNGMSWRPGPDLPTEVAAAASVTDPFGSVYLFGGEALGVRSATIFRLRHSKSPQWELLPYNLKTSRALLLAIPVADWMYNCV
jgi:hypothetical protein